MRRGKCCEEECVARRESTARRGERAEEGRKSFEEGRALEREKSVARRGEPHKLERSAALPSRSLAPSSASAVV